MLKINILFTIIILNVGTLLAQISTNTTPYSFFLTDKQEVIVHTINSPALDGLLNNHRPKSGNPVPVGVIAETHIDLPADGQWDDIPGKGKICRLGLYLPGTAFMSVYFSEFSLPEGATVHVYSADGKNAAGGFTSENNVSGGPFALQPVEGDNLILELFIPYNVVGKPDIIVSGLSYIPAELKSTSDFGNGGKCEVNVACEEGNNWKENSKGVVRILIRNGSSVYWCTGSLVNNVKQDKTPYLLTADHCGNGASTADINQWVFFFNYNSQICPNPIQQPKLQSMTGASKIAASRHNSLIGSDFFLVLLKNDVPKNYYSYFEGWSADGTPSDSGVCIHHPQGDIKKISTYKTPTVSAGWESTPNTHWKVSWSETANGHGVTEGGSSGSPLFSNNGHLIGTLTGGESSCDTANWNKPDYYGKMSFHWESNGEADTLKLKPWLDPDNTGTLTMGGMVMGTNSNISKTGIEIFPVPADDLLNIRLMSGQDWKNSSLILYNSLGNKVFTTIIQNTDELITLNTSNLKPGLYILKIASASLEFTEKIIIK